MSIFTRINRRYQIHRAVRELSALNNETLRDIGIERRNIASMVEHMIDQNVTQPTSVRAVARDRARKDLHLTGGAAA